MGRPEEDEVPPLSADESALLEWLEQDRGIRETATAAPASSAERVDPAPRPDMAESLAKAWSLLDVLPRHESPPRLASTTLEMVAVVADGGGAAAEPVGTKAIARFAAAALAILVSLAAGYAAGLVTRGDTDVSGSAKVPVAMHLGVLREAGSVEFLEALAARESLRLPDRFAFGPPRPYPELQKAIDAFVAAGFADSTGSEPAAAGRQSRGGGPTTEGDGTKASDRPSPRARLAGGSWKDATGEPVVLSAEERRELSESMATFDRLPPGDRRALIELARALADPSRSELVEAARLWHGFVQFADPVDRRGLLELGTRERLEWIERRMRPWRGMPAATPGGPQPRPGGPPFRPGPVPRRTPPAPD